MANVPSSDWYPVDPSPLTVWDDEPNPMIGTLLDARGEVLKQVRAREPFTFGFHPSKRQ